MNPAASETDEAYRHFSETLEAELVANVKPVIMSLTMLAEDYSAHSAYIARAIEEYILKVRPELKILGLYLMDSIMKNLKQTTNYIKIFEKNIVSVFCRVFSAVDESQRRALYKLRQTWNVLFSNAALLDLDKSVQQLDPAWPITATTSLPSSSSSSSTTANSRVQQQATTSVIKPPVQQLQQPQPQPQTQPQQQQQQLKKVPTPTPIPSQTQPQPQQQKQPSIEPSTQPSTVPTITTMMNKTTVAAPVVRDRDPRLIRAQQQQQQQQPTTATVIRSSGGGQISPPSTKSSESSTDLSIGGGSGVKPTQSSSMTAIGGTQSTQSSPSKPASSALVNLKRTSTSDLHPKVEAKKPKMIVVSPPPDKDPTNQILPPPVKPPAASKTTSPKTGAKTAAAAKAKTTTSPSGKTTTTAAKTSTKVPSVLDLELNPDEKPTTVAAPTKKVKNEGVVKTAPAKQPTTTTTTTTTVAQTVTPASQTSANNSKAAAIATLKNAAKLQALVSNTTTKPPNSAATTSTTGVKSMIKRLQNTDKILAAAAAAAASTQTQLQSNQNHTTSTTNHNHNNSHKTSVVDSKQSDDLLQPLSDVDERFGDVDERFIPPTSGSTSSKAEAVSSDPIALAAAAMKNLFESSSSATTSLANITNHPTTSTIISALLQSGTAAAATSSASSALTSQTIPTPLPVVSGSGLRQQTSSPPLSRPPRNHDQENSYDQEQQENLTAATTTTSTNSDEYVSYEDLPALRPRDSTDSLSDSLLIIDGRQYRLAANTARKLHIYYHDHEVLCDTRSKDVYVDKKRVAKMGDPSKEVTLNGRRVRIMYMGQRVEVWIDGMAYQFRADSPPKPISLPSTTLNGVIKRYYVTVDSRTMEMFFNNYRVCQIDPMSTATLSVRLAPDDFEQHEISFVCPPKMIMIDDTPRKMRYDLPVPCIEMPDGYHAIKFDSPGPKSIFIDDLQFVVPFNRSVRIRLNGRAHELAWGGPGFEVIIDGRPYELQFDKSPREILIGMRTYSVCIKGEPPDVKVLGRLPPELLDYQQQSIDASAAAAREISSQNQSSLNNNNNNRFANNTGSSSAQQPVQQPTAPNVQDLVKKLFDYKILQIPGASSSKPSETSTTTTSHPPPPITTVPPPTLNKPPPPIVAAIDEPKTPDLTSFDSELLKIKYPAAIKSLYLGQQCATCGNRFPPQQQNGGGVTINRYARHLDWHFRQNKKEKLEANKAHSRAWYYSLCEWSLYEELSDEKMPPPSGSAQATGADKNSASSSSGAAASSGIGTDGIAEEDLVDNGETSESGGANSGSANSNAQNSTNPTTGGSLSSGGLGIIGNGIRTCPASDDVDDSCCICNDPFEIFWFAEKEEWHFKDAIRVDNKLYHPICFEDAREEEHNNSSINLSRSQSFMDSETTTNATTAAPISPPSPSLSSSDNIDMEHSGLIKNVDSINSDDKLVKVEPL